MAKIVTMPRQGNTVESCILVGWHAKEGDPVSAATVLCEVETDKAVFEVPAGSDGTVLKLLAGEGDDIPVLRPIAVIGEAGEDWTKVPGLDAIVTNTAAAAASPAAASSLPPAAPAAQPAAQAPTAPSPSTQAAGTSIGVSPRARALADKEAINASSLAGSGPGGRVIERDVRSALEGRAPLSAAAQAAVRAGALAPASGSGAGGRALLADIAAPAPGSSAAGDTAVAKAAAAGNDSFPGPFTETPIKSIRKIIAERMRESLGTTAQYTLQASANATRLQALRARLKSSPATLGLSGVTVGDLVLFTVSRVLADHPNCNSLKVGDSVKTFVRVHLGLAVDTPRGLMVPVIKNADLLSLAQISFEAKRLAAACIEGKASPDELSGSTFTVSNLGSFGVEYFTPVINTPEVCVLGVGTILPKPFAAADGSTAFAPAIGLSLTLDHQVVDGAPGARLLRDLVAALADIDLWLAR
ncbi:MAG: dihydrolipoamide acetyltransferase family protein [Rectinemataceae bacterium]